MNFDIIIVFIILIGAIVLFAMEKFPVDLTAIIVMAALLLTGIITPEEGIAGFSNTATVTVGAMFILSAALFNTGALNFVGDILIKNFNKSYRLGLTIMLVIIGIISAFINVTAVVAVFLPVVMNVAKQTKISPSKLLIPLSFGALFGGVGTLIGTSTNILVSSIASKHNMPPFRMFEMTPLGLIILCTGILYLVIVGSKFLPDRKNLSDLTEKFQIDEYMTEVILMPGSQSVGKKIKDSFLKNDLDVEIIEIHRKNDTNILLPEPDTMLEANDIIRIRCNIDKVKQIQKIEGVILKSDKNLLNENPKLSKLVEAVVTHNSRLRGSTIKSINFRETYGANVLAIRHRGVLMNEKLGHTTLLPGDVLLIEVKDDWLPRLRQNPDFVIISEVNLAKVKKAKAFTAAAIMIGVVVIAANGIFPIVQSAIIGSVLMVLTGCITLEGAYKAINWKVIFLLAGVLTLGLGIEKSGAALLIAKFLINSVGVFGNVAMVSSFFILTLLFTNFMSNNATAALLAPIAIITAHSLGVSSRPFLMAVTFAASLSFMTPVGYQTNMMIYGPGNYKFTDYLKVGTPLDIIMWILATLLIPIFFPF